MSAIALLSLLGLALFIPVFMDSEADESEAPTEPDSLEGTEGDDLMETTGGQSANGFGGNDSLTSSGDSEFSNLDGGAGDDLFEVNGLQGSALGADGNDTFVVTGDADDVFGGEGDDTLTVEADRNSALGDAGNDRIFVGGSDNYADGGDGEDLIYAEGSGGDVLGGAGDDHITAQGSFAVVDGGIGNDTIEYNTSTEGSGDTLTGGNGADSFELTLHLPDQTDPSCDAGIVTTNTDFDPDEEVVLLTQDIQSAQSPREEWPSPATVTGFELVEAEDGSFTDIIFEAAGTDSDAVVTGTIRLLGTTGVTATNIEISRLDSGITV